MIDKSGIDIVSVIEQSGIELQRAGSRFKAICPFHSEKTPSMMVSPDNQRFHCFGCGATGDAIEFVMKRYEIPFKEALVHLGIEPGKIDLPKARQFDRQKRLASEYEQWEIKYCEQLGWYIRESYHAMAELTPEDFELYGGFLHGLVIWEYHLEIMIHGSPEDKLALYLEWKRKNGR